MATCRDTSRDIDPALRRVGAVQKEIDALVALFQEQRSLLEGRIGAHQRS